MVHRFCLLLLVLPLLFASCEEPLPATPPGNKPVNNQLINEDGKPGIDEVYENSNREVWQKPELVIDALGSLSGKTVADIGAGQGFFAARLAKTAERVVAIDINPTFIAYLEAVRDSLPAATRDRMEVRLADRNDPNLRDGETDVIMMVNTFMYIENQEDYLRLLKKKLKPGGQLLIVDFKRKRTPIGPNAKLRLPLFELEDMLVAAGYRLERSDDRSLDYQYVVRASI